MKPKVVTTLESVEMMEEQLDGIILVLAKIKYQVKKQHGRLLIMEATKALEGMMR